MSANTATVRQVWWRDHNGNWLCGVWLNGYYVGQLGPMHSSEKAAMEAVLHLAGNGGSGGVA